MAGRPHLAKEIALAILMEDRFGLLGLLRVRVHGPGHNQTRRASVRALNQQSRRSICGFLDPILTGRSVIFPAVNAKGIFTSRASCARATWVIARKASAKSPVILHSVFFMKSSC